MYEEENIEPEFLKRHKSSPFRTPDHYFDSIEDRIMGGIGHEAKMKTSSTKVFRLLKPVLGLAASLLLVCLLVYYPIRRLQTKSMVKTETADTTAPALTEAYALNISLIDENSLVNVLLGNETSNSSKINPDELLAYLSTGMNDVEIYSEIQN